MSTGRRNALGAHAGASSVAPIAVCYRGSLRPSPAWFSPSRQERAHGREHYAAAPAFVFDFGAVVFAAVAVVVVVFFFVP